MAGSVERNVGLFVIGGLVLLGILTILVEDFRLFSDTYSLLAYFPSVDGLQRNDPVTLGGVEVGKVSGMQVIDRQVELQLDIEQDVVVRSDSVASVRMTSLFGGKNVALTIGSADAPPLADGDVLMTVDGTGVDIIMEQAGEAVNELRDLAVSFNDNQEKVLGKIYAMLEENEDDLNETVIAFREAAGTIREVAPKLDNLVDSATGIANRLEAGEGTAGKLLASDELYNDVRELTDSLKNAAEAADRILSDNESDLREAVASLRDAGTSINETLDRVSSVAIKIDEGQGTLGKMVNDPALYDDAREALDGVNNAAESVREQMPMMSFMSVLFRAFGG